MAQGARGEWRTDRLALPNDVKLALQGAGAPTDGASGTGAKVAGPGSFYINISAGAVYVNTNTKASPTWTQLGSVAALTAAHIFVGNAGGAAADVALSGDATIDNAGKLTLATSLVRTDVIDISSADIVATTAGKLSHAGGVALVAAPAAGKIIELISCLLAYNFAGAGYGGGGNLTVNLTGGAAISGLVSAANSLGAGSDKIARLAPTMSTNVGPETAAGVATGLSLVSSAVPWTLGSATGTLRAIVTYRVHDTGL